MQIGAGEKILQENCDKIRVFIKQMIEMRRKQLQDPTYKNKGDFLTLLINDEVFKDQDSYIVDECLTFMLAGTMTNTLMLNNSIYYLTQSPLILRKLRSELASKANRTSFSDLSNEEWSRLLLNTEDRDSDLLANCDYLGYCVNETLRIDPSIRVTSLHEISDPIEVAGKKILKDQQIAINVAYLHHNPD